MELGLALLLLWGPAEPHSQMVGKKHLTAFWAAVNYEQFHCALKQAQGM